MKVKLICHTENCENLVACAAKLCYSSSTIDDLISKVKFDESSKFIEMLVKLGHESPLEHINFTFGIEGVSRSLLAQITRHRIASFSVQSQRYVLENDFSFVIPPKIKQNERCNQMFNRFMMQAQKVYNDLMSELNLINEQNLIKKGYSKVDAKIKAKKISCEDARFVLPNACCCKLMCTMNARSLFNFFRLRCCFRAQWEINELAFKMLELVIAVAPNIFKYAGPDCVRSGCSQGKMSCGLSHKVKSKINGLLNKGC